MTPRRRTRSSRADAKTTRRRTPQARVLDVSVVWGDVARARGDVHLVGHYLGILPQNAELVLDRAISASSDGRAAPRLLITELTRCGAVRGALGEVLFFPWGRNRVVAVAGMGRSGTFHKAQLLVLARNVAATVGMLPGRRILTSVLIGSGAGNLSVHECVEGMVGGLLEALERDRELGLKRLRIVEQSLDRALEILAALKELYGKDARVKLAPRLKEEQGGTIPSDFGCSMVLASLVGAGRRRRRSTISKALESLLDELPHRPLLREQVTERLQRTLRSVRRRAESDHVRDVAMALRLRATHSPPRSQEIPTRVAFWQNRDAVHASAITDTTTVTERALARRFKHVERAIERLQNPEPRHVQSRGEEMLHVLVPDDLREVFARRDSLVIEVDRSLSRVQWEMLAVGRGGDPLAITRPVARQLRTQYSPRPVEFVRLPALRALVIGDPGDPLLGHSLPSARKEALAVTNLLRQRGVQTEVLLGAPEDGIGTHAEGLPPADFFEVVRLLLRGGFDIVHYSGHAQFDAESNERTGWLFKDGLLTAHELEGMDRTPQLVVANACVSLQLSQQTSGRGSAESAEGAAASGVRERGDALLVAGLADEFFRRGVADYVGTSWEVPSIPAVDFARIFYSALLGDGASKPLRFGDALMLARARLYDRRAKYGSAWGAYQHYGDPTRVLQTSPAE